jgi:hypothetical protein
MLRTEECCQIAARDGGKIADQAVLVRILRAAPAWLARPVAQ